MPKAITRKPGEAVRVLEQWDQGDPGMQVLLAEARELATVAQMVYDARIAAGLTQKELAKLVGTTQSVISQLEDADYAGHSLKMLRRIGLALGLEVEVAFRPKRAGVGVTRRRGR